MDGIPLSQSVTNEMKSTVDKSLPDLPMNVSSIIKLLADIIALSKFFLKKSPPDQSSSEEAANILMAEILALDIKRDLSKERRLQLSSSYVALAKADLLPNVLLSKEDRDGIARLGLKDISHQGQYLSSHLKLQQIYQFMSLRINKKYQPTFKQLIEHAFIIATIGFASYNVLLAKIKYDTNRQSNFPVFDIQRTVISEKNIILNILDEVSQSKINKDYLSKIMHYHKEISTSIDQIRYAYEEIDLELLKKECTLKQQQIDALVTAILKIKKAATLLDLKIEFNNTELILLARKTKSKEQLLKLIDELEIKYSYLIAELNSQKKMLENNLITSDTQIQNHITQHINEMKNADSKVITISANNKILDDNLNAANTTIQHLQNNLIYIKNHTPWWHYGLCALGIGMGAILCVSGVGLLASATVLGILSIIMGGAIIVGHSSYMGYKVYKHYNFHPDIPPPPAESKTVTPLKSITLPPVNELKTPQPSPRHSDTLTNIHQPLFSPRSRDKTTFTPEASLSPRP